MFSKMLIYIFVFLAIFLVVFSNMPSAFIATYFASSAGYDHEIADFYSLANVTMYAQAENFSLGYPQELDFSFGLPGNQRIQFIWSDDFYMGKSIQVRHLVAELFGAWYDWHQLLYDFLPSQSPPYANLLRYDVVHNWDEEVNASLFWAECPHMRMNMFISPNGTYTDIGESWDNDELSFLISYEVDWNATQLSAFNILGRLLTFQSPDLGIPGVGGEMMNMVIAAPIWIMVAILIILIIQSVIPFIKGIDE